MAALTGFPPRVSVDLSLWVDNSESAFKDNAQPPPNTRSGT
jgi:hypothetical protein